METVDYHSSHEEQHGSVPLDYFEWCASFLTAPPMGPPPLPHHGCVITEEEDDIPSLTSSPSPSTSPVSTPECYPYPSSSSSSHSPSSVVPTSVIFASSITNTAVLTAPLGGHHHHHPASAMNMFYMPPISHHGAMMPVPHPFAFLKQQFSHEGLHHVFPHTLNHSYNKKRDYSQVKEETSVSVPKTIERLPEFLYATPDPSDFLQTSTFETCFQYPQPFHRNCYEVLRLRIPSSLDDVNYEGYRIYIDSKIGYSGNAKRFKHAPDPGERAFVLRGQLLDHNKNPIIQCQTCEEYFKDSQKWVLLIKNNLPIYVQKGEFSLQMKLMCCSSHHHNSPFYFYVTLFDVVANKIVLNTLFAANVKQWKNMACSSTVVTTPAAKKKKTEPG